MNIRTRITLLVTLTFLTIAAIGGYAVLQSQSNAKQVRQVTEGVVPSALASADLVALFKDLQLTLTAMMFEANPDIARQSGDRYAAGKNRLLAALDQQFAQADGDRQHGLVNEIRENINSYFESADQAIALKLAGQADLAKAMLAANAAQYQRETEQMIDALRVEKYRRKDDAIVILNDSLTTTVVAISTVTIITVLLLTGLGVLLYRQIVGPIRRMQTMMSDIASNQDFTRRLPIAKNDEIGQSMRAFNAMIEKIQESSAQLRQKTNDIQTMLQNIPQGILTVGAGAVVHHEYSAHLENILETRQISGSNLMQLIFADTGMGADRMSQIDTTVRACIGEDIMNFDFNRHLLIGEIERKMPDGRTKMLDLNWSTIVDERGQTERLMLCVRDVTELRKLASAAREQERTLAIIGEILGVSQEKFHEFILGAIDFVDQNERAIHQHPEFDADIVTQLFRNMHTIKGNARTYGLQHLTNVVHEAEQVYAELRKPYPDIAWDQAQLADQLAQVRAEIERYATINEVSLGRKGPGRRGGVERYLMVDRRQVHDALHLLDNTRISNIHDLLAVTGAVHKMLRLLGTESVSEALAGVLDSLPSLAAELGKEAPVVSINNGGYVVRNQISSVLKNVFMHLMRNAMDHGIETPSEREAKGKPRAGQLKLRAAMQDGCFNLELADDGRGLALARIRNLAVERELTGRDERLSDSETAALIFRAGFSTAAAVTEVSGRGVGMDAVQDFVRREGGTIRIVFDDGEEGAEFRAFRTVISLPENCAVKIDPV